MKHSCVRLAKRCAGDVLPSLAVTSSKEISVAWRNVGEAATLGTAVGPSENAGHATRSTNVAEIPE